MKRWAAILAVTWLAACSAERAAVTPSLRQSVECGDGVQVEASLDETRAAARAVLLDEAFRVAALGDQLKANRRFANIATGKLVLLGRDFDVVTDAGAGSGAVLRLDVALTDLGGHVCLDATASPVGFTFVQGAFERFLSTFGEAVRRRIERTRKPPPTAGVATEYIPFLGLRASAATGHAWRDARLHTYRQRPNPRVDGSGRAVACGYRAVAAPGRGRRRGVRGLPRL